MLFVARALAQDEACAPVAVERFAAGVEAARAALVELHVDRAEALLDQLLDEARCLAEPVPPELLGRLARLEAVRWLYDQDPEAIASWAGLAARVDPDGAWPVADDHPIRRMMPARPPPADRAGPEGRGVLHPRKGGVFVDGAFLEEPRATLGEPHLVQLFGEDGERLGGWWQDGAAFRDEILADGPTAAEPPRWWTGAPEVPDFPAARRDTVEAYAGYLEKDPLGEHAAYARRRLDDLSWEAAADEGTPDAARAYLASWPHGRNADAARFVLEKEAFGKALAEGTAAALEVFRSRWPHGAYAVEAGRRLDDLAWAAAAGADTSDAYAGYLLRWPGGRHAREARLAREELAWTEAAASEAGLRRYLEQSPHGAHADEARAILAGARFWSVDLGVAADPDVSKAVADALAKELGRQGLEVVRVGTRPAAVPAGTALVWVTVTRSASGILEGNLELRVAGIDRPLMQVVTASMAVATDPGARAQLAARLVDELPPLGRWTRPRP